MKRFLLTLGVLFSAIFSLVAKPVPTDFGEKVHIGVIGQNAPILHQVDESTSVELQWVTQDNYLYDAIGSPVRPGSGGRSVTSNHNQYAKPIGPVAPKSGGFGKSNLSAEEFSHEFFSRYQRYAEDAYTQV